MVSFPLVSSAVVLAVLPVAVSLRVVASWGRLRLSTNMSSTWQADITQIVHSTRSRNDQNTTQKKEKHTGLDFAERERERERERELSLIHI